MLLEILWSWCQRLPSNGLFQWIFFGISVLSPTNISKLDRKHSIAADNKIKRRRSTSISQLVSLSLEVRYAQSWSTYTYYAISLREIIVMTATASLESDCISLVTSCNIQTSNHPGLNGAIYLHAAEIKAVVKNNITVSDMSHTPLESSHEYTQCMKALRSRG